MRVFLGLVKNLPQVLQMLNYIVVDEELPLATQLNGLHWLLGTGSESRLQPPILFPSHPLLSLRLAQRHPTEEENPSRKAF